MTVRVLLDDETAARLRAGEANLADWRTLRGHRIADPALLPRLPEALAHEPEWRARVLDLAIVRRQLRGRSRVLDVGAYNGWLSNRLSEDGHDVTAAEVFGDAFDGIGARAHYPNARWAAVQCNLHDLSVLGETYDLVVINRCLAYFADPAGYVAHALQRVRPGGTLLATGLAFFRDPSRKIRSWDVEKAAFRARYGSELFFLHACKGFLTFDDRDALARVGLRFRVQARLLRTNVLSLVDRTWPRCGYGVATAAR
jgi:SAM-dependent methyltransferase